ncbi:MAG TPA: 23S rRNA (pseudouridine(1915)-N(3))-methyltransferase RlmH [Clostridia bacterium]|nr:23S rRNA (pseudouridine(1915)-N(3))-methyltransferase RlmH [Clostridia bacterium]
MRINIVAVGKLKEKYWKDAISEYSKRMQKYFNLNIIEVNEYSNSKNIEVIKEQEGQAILSKVKGKTVLLDIKGDLVSSEDLSSFIEESAVKGESEITFIIGGSNGVSEQVKDKSDKIISFGKVTYPHQMTRLILIEQIYRAGTIMNNESYHK